MPHPLPSTACVAAANCALAASIEPKSRFIASASRSGTGEPPGFIECQYSECSTCPLAQKANCRDSAAIAE